MQVRPIGSNQTELIKEDGTVVLFSYETPVAAYLPDLGYVKTSKKWSQTTSRHVNKWADTYVESLPQNVLYGLVQ